LCFCCFRRSPSYNVLVALPQRGKLSKPCRIPFAPNRYNQQRSLQGPTCLSLAYMTSRFPFDQDLPKTHGRAMRPISWAYKMQVPVTTPFHSNHSYAFPREAVLVVEWAFFRWSPILILRRTPFCHFLAGEILPAERTFQPSPVFPVDFVVRDHVFGWTQSEASKE